MFLILCGILIWFVVVTAWSFIRAGGMPIGPRLLKAFGAGLWSVNFAYGLCALALMLISALIFLLECLMCLFVMAAGILAFSDDERLKLSRAWSRYLRRL